MDSDSTSSVITPSSPSTGKKPEQSRLPELLAPAGDWECARAAIENGADAIYFGLEQFNARMRAENFTESDLPKLMEFLHRRGVKGYVTFNTLVFENELAEAEHYARAIIANGVDAAIVQDIGICRLIRQLSPDFPIHVSTQMTVTSAEGIEFARELGCNLVVLARECSLKEIRKIITGTTPNAPSLPIEVFVHGALCVAYSGQCLTSEALGGRSANRGECAQACRMPYELVSDGEVVPLGNRKYLLSPQDLAGLELLPELMDSGVASLKIEGRLKSPEYVANITRIYRQALDQLVGESASASPRSGETAALRKRTRYEMEMAFSRGLYTGWFGGINNQQLVHANFGKKRGVYLGEVLEIRQDGVCALLHEQLQPGDGVVFDAGNPEDKEEGGRIYEVTLARGGQSALLRFGYGDIDFARVHVGDKLWKTSDPKLERALHHSYQGNQPKFQRHVSMEVHGQVGQPLTLIVRDEAGHVVRCQSSIPLSKAENQPLTTQRLHDQLGRLGGSPFALGNLENHLAADVLLPISELNRLRREAVIQLQERRAGPPRWTLCDPLRSPSLCVETSRQQEQRTAAPAKAPALQDPQLIVLVRNLAQLETALSLGIQTIYCDFENPKRYREAVGQFRNCSPTGSQIFVAPPRIFKMGEEWVLKQVRSSEADGYLVRNYDHLRFFAKDRCIGDYSFNIANRLAADYLKTKFRLERITTSYDLNFAQLAALLRAAPAEWFEITLHQHMPMFHMEHCLFCAFLSEGTDYTNCGRPCDHHDVQLRDRVGAQHPVKADAGCRNTVFNARAQTGAEYAQAMRAMGVRYFRIEFVNEKPEVAGQTIEKYRQLLNGKITGAQLWRELKLINQLGVTRGQIAR